MFRIIKIISVVCVLLLTSYSQDVIKIGKAYGSVSEQLNSTYEMARGNDDFWIGYSIKSQNKHNFSVGSFSLFDDDVKVTLRDLIEMTPRYVEFKNRSKNSNSNNVKRSVHIINGRIITDDELDTETAILFRYDRNSTGISDFAEIAICNLSQYVDIYGFTLYWLDEIESQKSADYIIDMYKNSDSWFVREELVSAIGIHSNYPKVTTVLKNIIYGNDKSDMKEDALFWMGIQNNEEAFEILVDVIDEENFGELREDAVMALSYSPSENTLEKLISIAKRNDNRNLREHAIYGIGNIAVEKAEEVLKDFIENDPDIEIKKRAIYALGDREEENIPYLIDIANNHSSLTIRKTAIYSLSNSEDERAIDALIELAKNN